MKKIQGEDIQLEEVDIDNTPMAYGKYKGKTPDEISEINPNYLIALYNNSDIKPCTKALYQFCKEVEDNDDFYDDFTYHDLEF